MEVIGKSHVLQHSVHLFLAEASSEKIDLNRRAQICRCDAIWPDKYTQIWVVWADSLMVNTWSVRPAVKHSRVPAWAVAFPPLCSKLWERQECCSLTLGLVYHKWWLMGHCPSLGSLFIYFSLIYFFKLILASEGICFGRFLDNSLAWGDKGSVEELSHGSKPQLVRTTLICSHQAFQPHGESSQRVLLELLQTLLSLSPPWSPLLSCWDMSVGEAAVLSCSLWGVTNVFNPSSPFDSHEPSGEWVLRKYIKYTWNTETEYEVWWIFFILSWLYSSLWLGSLDTRFSSLVV